MDKETKKLIDMQMICLNICSGVKQARITKIFRKHTGLDIYYELIKYESELLKAEGSIVTANNLPGYQEEFEQMETELLKTKDYQDFCVWHKEAREKI